MRGHVAIVTGAAQGVGKGVAAALLERGASVLLVDIQDEALSTTTAELERARPGRECWSPTCATRTTRSGSWRPRSTPSARCMAWSTTPSPPTSPRHSLTSPLDDLALGHDVGPRATFLLMQAVHPLMVEAGGGSIVNLGSGTGHRRRAQVGRLCRRKGSHPRAIEGRRPGMGARQHPRQRHLPVRRVRRRQVLEVSSRPRSTKRRSDAFR